MDRNIPYDCPACGTENRIHELGCKYEDEPLAVFEKPYIDLLSILTAHGADNEVYGAKEVISKSALVRKVEQLHEKNPWLERHEDCLQKLVDSNHVTFEDGGLRHVPPDEQVERLIPHFEPLRTIYEYGPVDGAKDYAVYTMVSWCSLKEMTWNQTMNFVTEWLRETGAWSREDWSELSPEELVRDKHHVWESDLGWGDMAEAAKTEIENRSPPKGIDISEKRGATYEDYDT